MKTSKAIKIFGSKKAIAKALGISGPAVSRWGDEVPKLRAYELKEIIAQAKALSQVA